LPTSSHTYAVMESSQMLILRNKRAAADAKIAFKMPIPIDDNAPLGKPL
jgi:hypothetical protein